jgi:hypothetical protein
MLGQSQWQLVLQAAAALTPLASAQLAHAARCRQSSLSVGCMQLHACVGLILLQHLHGNWSCLRRGCHMLSLCLDDYPVLYWRHSSITMPTAAPDCRVHIVRAMPAVYSKKHPKA